MGVFSSTKFGYFLNFILLVLCSRGKIKIEVFVREKDGIQLEIETRKYVLREGMSQVDVVCSYGELSSGNATIALVKNGPKTTVVCENSRKTDDKGIAAKWNIESVNQSIAGNYLCRLKVVVGRSKQRLMYVLESEFTLMIMEDPCRLIDVNGTGPSYQISPDPKFDHCAELQKNDLDEKSSGVNLYIRPPTFSSNTGVLDFSCDGTQAVLLYWIVNGSNGNFFHTYNVTTNTNITIRQSVGITSLRISEAIAGENGLHLVKCVTEDGKEVFSSVTQGYANTSDRAMITKPTLTNPYFHTAISNEETGEESLTSAHGDTHSPLNFDKGGPWFENSGPSNDLSGRQDDGFTATSHSELTGNLDRFQLKGTLNREKSNTSGSQILLTSLCVVLVITIMVLCSIMFIVASKKMFSRPIRKGNLSGTDDVISDVGLHDNPAYVPYHDNSPEPSSYPGRNDAAQVCDTLLQDNPVYIPYNVRSNDCTFYGSNNEEETEQTYIAIDV